MIKTHGLGQDVVFMPAFSDISPGRHSLLGPCDFLLLAAGQSNLAKQRDGSLGYEAMRQVYSGIGLMVQESPDAAKGSSDCVQWIGAIKFGDMTKQNWETLCRVCSQEDGVLSAGDGQRLCLV